MTSVSFNSRTTSLVLSDTYGDSALTERLFLGLTVLDSELAPYSNPGDPPPILEFVLSDLTSLVLSGLTSLVLSGLTSSVTGSMM